MKKCQGCGNTVLPGWSFCPSCNRDLRILPATDDLQPPAPGAGVDRSPADLSRRCRNCGHLNREGADSCEACDYWFTSHELRLDSPVVIGVISIFAVLLFVLLSLPGGLLSGQQYIHQFPPPAGIGVLPVGGLNASLTKVTTLPTSLPLPVVPVTIVPTPTILTTTLLASIPAESGAPSIVRQPAIITSIVSPTPGNQVPVVPAGLPNASSLPASTIATSLGVSSLPSTPAVTSSITPVSNQVVAIPMPANGHQTGQLAWAGAGNYASDFFTLPPGEVRLSATAEASPGVIAEVRDRTGTVLGKVSATGRQQQGSTMLTIPENSTYLMAVTGEGGWTVAITQATLNIRSQPADLTVAATVTATLTGVSSLPQQGVATPQLPPTHSSLPVSQGTLIPGGVTIPIPG